MGIKMDSDNAIFTILKQELIKKLKEEIKFLENTKATDEEIKNYRYGLCGDLSEFRRF